jgi:nitrite reductase/ring-hydroxylating ferredoxin subunit
MSEWTELLPAGELADGQMKAMEGPDRKLLVARVGDDFYVTQAHCQHMGANLAKGTLEGAVVTCPLHGSQYDVTDGHVIRWTSWTNPALCDANEAVRPRRALQTYDVKVEAEAVWVGAERPLAEADEA